MRLQATWEEERTVRSSKSGRLALEEYFRHSRAPFPSKLHALQTAGLRLNLLYLHRQERLLHEQVRKKGGEDEFGYEHRRRLMDVGSQLVAEQMLADLRYELRLPSRAGTPRSAECNANLQVQVQRQWLMPLDNLWAPPGHTPGLLRRFLSFAIRSACVLPSRVSSKLAIPNWTFMCSELNFEQSKSTFVSV